MKKIRIFISSPGDVIQERNIARSVITELNDLYSKYVKLEVLMWEDFPLSADSTFQEGINYFLNEDKIDIAIFILWSRLGTPLCSKFIKPDGSPYKSGTEYEFDMMMQLFKDKGWPRILTYIKKSEFKPNAGNLKELEDILRQKENVDAFIHEYFHDEENNSNYAYLQFGESSSFEQKFRTHLTNAIKTVIGNVGEIREWNGNPYVGLNSFEYEQSSIFFGRKQLVYETASKLIDFNDVEQKKSLIVLGESGSGKSSFIKAGLLPFLCKEKPDNAYAIVSPSMYGGEFYQGLLDLLEEKYAFLKGNPFMEELRVKIDDATNFKYLSFAFSQHQYDDLILYIDQFEELFSDNSITEEERLKVILLLKGIVSTNKLSIFISMRSDYYGRFSQYGSLAQLKEMCVGVDIPVIGHSEFKSIVEEPARKACLKWEVDDNANALNERIVKEAMVIKDLPLIEFALSELYKLRDENDYLTFEAYDRIGGLKGAMVAYADNFYSALSPEEQEALSVVLGFVIAYSSSGRQNTYVRKTSFMKDVCSTEVQKMLVKKLIDAHLLVAGKDNNAQSTVTIVHETLISHWSVLRNWIEQQKDFLTSSAYYEQRAQHWASNGRSSRELITERTALLEVEYFLYKYSRQVSNEVNSFLLASIKKERRKGVVWQSVLGVLSLLGLVGIVWVKSSGFEYDETMNEWFGDINNTSLPQLLLVYMPLCCVLIHSLLLRFIAKPKYQTVKYSLCFWGVLFMFLLIDGLFMSRDLSNGFVLFVDAVVLMIIISVFFDLRRRTLWKFKKLVTYRFSEKWMERMKAIAVGGTVLFMFLYPSMAAMMVSEEKNEENEKLLNIADELFDGLNNISASLSQADNIYINEKRFNYLRERFEEELSDTIPDEREFQFATCLYNLKYPEKAIQYLYPSINWRDHLFFIYSVMQYGRSDIADYLLESYVEDGRYDNFNWLKTEDLIWVSEKVGRFDLAERLYETVEKNNVDMTDLAYVINRAHIHLYDGDIKGAEKLYQHGLEDELYAEVVKISIEKDFHTFSYLEVIDDRKLQHMADILNVSFAPSYTTPDSALTAQLYEDLHGNWKYQDEKNRTLVVSLTIDKDVPLARYSCYTFIDSLYTEQNRFVSLLRFEERDGEILWDEYYPENDDNYYGRICERTDEYFVLEIMENGNPEDKGTKRTFVRIE